ARSRPRASPRDRTAPPPRHAGGRALPARGEPAVGAGAPTGGPGVTFVPSRGEPTHGAPASSRDPSLERGAVLAAGCVALAEAGLIVLPLRLVDRQVFGSAGGVLPSYPAFVSLFVGGTVAATTFHRSGLMPYLIGAGGVVALFFAGSLASRAVSASLTARDSGSTVVRADGAAAATPSLRLPAALIGGLAAAVVLGVSLGGRGGPLELLGRIVLPALGWAI